MEIKIVGYGRFIDENLFEFEGNERWRVEYVREQCAAAGGICAYIDPTTRQRVESPKIGQRVAMVVPVPGSLSDSDLQKLYDLDSRDSR